MLPYLTNRDAINATEWAKKLEALQRKRLQSQLQQAPLGEAS